MIDSFSRAYLFLRAHLPRRLSYSQLALMKQDSAHATPKAKCPFIPQREMMLNLWREESQETTSLNNNF